MYFSYDDRKAVYYIARGMVCADGKIREIELHALTTEMLRIGSSLEELLEFENNLKYIKGSDCTSRISKFSDEKKKHFCALLGAIIIVDGDIDEKEMQLWSLTSYLCDLPTMSVADALEYMASL